MLDFLKRNSPPGIDLKPEYHFFIIGNGVSVLISFFTFLAHYLDDRRELFLYSMGKVIGIKEGSIIRPFLSFIDPSFLVFVFVAIVMFCFIIYHYAYYRQGSMSIYLMKRLPNSKERHKRALVVPSLAILATFVVALVTIFLCFLIYLIATPKICLPYKTLFEIWR